MPNLLITTYYDHDDTGLAASSFLDMFISKKKRGHWSFTWAQQHTGASKTKQTR